MTLLRGRLALELSPFILLALTAFSLPAQTAKTRNANACAIAPGSAGTATRLLPRDLRRIDDKTPAANP